jgi:hypothetical protein
MPATEPTQPWSWQAPRRMRPARMAWSASSTSAASSSWTAAASTARRWPP